MNSRAAEFRDFNSDLAAIRVQQKIRLLVRFERAGGKDRRRATGFFQVIRLQRFLAIFFPREHNVIFP
jgi:hypothetical protein